MTRRLRLGGDDCLVQLRLAYGQSDLFEIITADAGFSSRDNARLVHEADKGYVFALKDTYPELLRETNGFCLSANTPARRRPGRSTAASAFASRVIVGLTRR